MPNNEAYHEQFLHFQQDKALSHYTVDARKIFALINRSKKNQVNGQERSSDLNPLDVSL